MGKTPHENRSYKGYHGIIAVILSLFGCKREKREFYIVII
jgi:hypothetical protein